MSVRLSFDKGKRSFVKGGERTIKVLKIEVKKNQKNKLLLTNLLMSKISDEVRAVTAFTYFHCFQRCEYTFVER